MKALWAQIPQADLAWAQRLVDTLVRHARDAGTIATPQVIALDREVA